MTLKEREIAEGVRSLRAHLNESQQAFSNRLGVSLATISRYEVRNPPEGDMLLKLARIAKESGRADIEASFQAAYEQELQGKGPLARAIRDLRSKLDLTRQQLAQRLGVSVVSISRYETNLTPNTAILQRFAKLALENGLAEEAFVFRTEFVPVFAMARRSTPAFRSARAIC